MTALIRHLVFVVILICTVLVGRSQNRIEPTLEKMLRHKDSLLFDAAFNQCDPDTMASLFTEDFEFYHDKVGFTTGREAFLAPTREDCSQREPGAPQPANRILSKGSLSVYPLYDNGRLYGAIQHGIHRFEFLNRDRQYERGDTARFTHLWVLEEGNWKIKRELSYDHQPYHQEEIHQ